jgi:hypothetical protein
MSGSQPAERPLPKLEVLRAIEKASSNERRLVEIVAASENREAAVSALCEEFQFTRQAAAAVMDLQVLQLTRDRVAAIRLALMEEERRASNPSDDPE